MQAVLNKQQKTLAMQESLVRACPCTEKLQLFRLSSFYATTEAILFSEIMQSSRSVEVLCTLEPWANCCQSPLQVTGEKGAHFLKQRAVFAGKFPLRTEVLQSRLLVDTSHLPSALTTQSLPSQTSQGRQRQTWVLRGREITVAIAQVQVFLTPGLGKLTPPSTGTDLPSSSLGVVHGLGSPGTLLFTLQRHKTRLRCACQHSAGLASSVICKGILLPQQCQ